MSAQYHCMSKVHTIEYVPMDILETRTDTLSGVSNIYNSREALGFEKQNVYPIVWEVIFRNDVAGKAFVANLEKGFSHLPEEDGYILNLDGKHSDTARCVECVFKNAEAFRKLTAGVLTNIVIFDEEEGLAISQKELTETAQRIYGDKVQA